MQASDGFNNATQRSHEGEADAIHAMEAVLSLSAALSSAKDHTTAGKVIVETIIETIKARRTVLLVQNHALISDGQRYSDRIELAQFTDSLSSRTIPVHLLNEVIRSNRSAAWRSMDRCALSLGDYAVPDGVTEVVCVPMMACSKLVGLLYVEMDYTTPASGRIAREFLDLIANHCGAVLGYLQSQDQAIEYAQDNAILRGQLSELKALTSRLMRLGRGGPWVWDTITQSMSISTELRGVLGLAGAHHQNIKTIWDLEIRFGGQIPPAASAAVANGLPFETQIEIVRPADEILTTLLLAGEPDGSVPGRYVGVAFDIGSQLQRNFIERDRAILKHRLEELRHRMADPLTSIMLDSSAADRFLRRNHPDYEMVFSALSRIEGRASLISEMIDEAPETFSRPENYQWI